MRLFVLFFCAITASASAAYAAQPCALSSIAGCANTNELVWAKSFKPALHAFLDKKKVKWLGQRQDVADVVVEVLGGVPDHVVKVGDGMLRFSAVRPQSALERGAIFITETGAISAIGVLHFNCAKQCEKTYTLTVIADKKDALLGALVQKWGDEQMQLNKQNGLESELTSIGRVELLANKH